MSYDALDEMKERGMELTEENINLINAHQTGKIDYNQSYTSSKLPPKKKKIPLQDVSQQLINEWLNSHPKPVYGNPIPESAQTFIDPKSGTTKYVKPTPQVPTTETPSKLSWGKAFSWDAWKNSLAGFGLAAKDTGSAVVNFAAHNPVSQGVLNFATNYGPLATVGAAAGIGLGGYLAYKGAKKLFNRENPGHKTLHQLYPMYYDKKDKLIGTKDLSKYKLPTNTYPPTPTDQYLYPSYAATAAPNRWQQYPSYPYMPVSHLTNPYNSHFVDNQNIIYPNYQYKPQKSS